ncbi:MAG: transcriptional repressor for high-affinity phosphate uptake [Elusimicrobia bacterium]|nr:MAG: transcriptional repressor for high-affinity phosphate uptake [Elusimicrobiota bacterium]
MTMKRHIDEDLQGLREAILTMGALCEEMIHLAVKLLLEHDESLMAKVKADEDRVNKLHIEIDERCLRTLALHQPAAIDLRFVAAAIKINSDLERIGDQAVNIAETTLYLMKQPSQMLKDALDAFTRGDVALANDVIRRDDEEDRLKSQTFNTLVALMQSDSSTIQRGMDHILISRNLERIADHATNVAEDVVFMVLGKDIRHGGGVNA